MHEAAISDPPRVALYISTKFSITLAQPAKRGTRIKAPGKKCDTYVRTGSRAGYCASGLVRDLGELMAFDVPTKIIFDRPISNIARGNIRLRRGHLRSADCVYEIKHSSLPAKASACASKIDVN